MDHPGFGLSDGLHGYISNFDNLVDNVIEQYAKIKGLLTLLCYLSVASFTIVFASFLANCLFEFFWLIVLQL